MLELPDGTLRASLPAEIRIVGSAAFYDFDAKYLDDVCEFDIPAELDDDVAERVQERGRRGVPGAGLPGAGAGRLLRRARTASRWSTR